MGILILVMFFMLDFCHGSCQQGPVVPLSFSLYPSSLVCILLTITGTLSAPELDFLRQFVTERCLREDLT